MYSSRRWQRPGRRRTSFVKETGVGAAGTQLGGGEEHEMPKATQHQIGTKNEIRKSRKNFMITFTLSSWSDGADWCKMQRTLGKNIIWTAFFKLFRGGFILEGYHLSHCRVISYQIYKSWCYFTWQKPPKSKLFYSNSRIQTLAGIRVLWIKLRPPWPVSLEAGCGAFVFRTPRVQLKYLKLLNMQSVQAWSTKVSGRLIYVHELCKTWGIKNCVVCTNNRFFSSFFVLVINVTDPLLIIKFPLAEKWAHSADQIEISVF